MATTKLTNLWAAHFADGHIINQPEDDHYSKHDDTAEWNPSAFRDILDYEKTSPLVLFVVGSHAVDLTNGHIYVNNHLISMELKKDMAFAPPLKDRKLIFFRKVDWSANLGEDFTDPIFIGYVLGYEGKNEQGKVEKKAIFING